MTFLGIKLVISSVNIIALLLFTIGLLKVFNNNSDNNNLIV
jgi:hypothetical protein